MIKIKIKSNLKDLFTKVIVEKLEKENINYYGISNLIGYFENRKEEAINEKVKNFHVYAHECHSDETIELFNNLLSKLGHKYSQIMGPMYPVWIINL